MNKTNIKLLADAMIKGEVITFKDKNGYSIPDVKITGIRMEGGKDLWMVDVIGGKAFDTRKMSICVAAA